ncbi:MAG: DUF302 domain-containing protein [Methylococcales bacterium]|nr:DUF302 domain-containing protein [Methylococcales bacterium]
MRIFIFLSLSFLTACMSTQTQPNVERVAYYQAETMKPYDDVLAELEIAISDHNFRITGHSRVGKVIRDRGTKNFPEYDTLQFCNLTHAKTLLLMSPHAVSYMPCNVVVYTFEGKTMVKTHLLPIETENDALNQFSKKMNKLLRAIVDFSVEE